MTANQIIDEIAALPSEEQVKVIRFARRLETERQLTPADLGRLAERLAASNTPEESVQLREEIVRGFYGAHPDA